MNKHQKQVLVLCAAVLLAMLLFPPFQVQVRGTAFNMGYHYIAEPPRRGSIPASVNAQMLLVQWVGVALLGAVAVLLLKDSPDRGDTTPRPATSAPPPLSPTAPATPPPVDQSRTFLGGQHHPWRRYFARMVDSTLFVLAAGVALSLVSPSFAELASEPDTAVWLGIFGLLAMVPVEAALISSFKTTPGKWLFGIEVVGEDSAPLPFGAAAVRALRVWVQGLWFGLPVVAIAPMVFAHGRLTRTGTTLWDTACHAMVTHRPWTPARAIGAIATTLFVWVSLGLMRQESQLSSPSVQETSGKKITYDDAMKLPERKPRTVSYEEATGVKPSASATNEDGLAAYNRGDYAIALRVFRTLSDQGDTNAQNILGFMYANGQGETTNYAEAAKWYRLAAERGNTDAQNSLGFMYANGQGVTTNYAEAVKWHRLAAERGNTDAQNNLGAMYANGQGVTTNYAEAAKWYRLAAEQGNTDAQNNLGAMYHNGKGVTTNYAEAVKWYRLAAEAGRAIAQNNLGAMYANGQGVTTNYAEAAKWYRLAAERGNTDAQNNLGAMYANGQGVTTNYAEAVKWYRLAADQGDAYGQYNLGLMYYNGQGVRQDYLEAYKWFTLTMARSQASEPALREAAAKGRDDVATRLTPVQIAEAQRLAGEWKPVVGSVPNP